MKPVPCIGGPCDGDWVVSPGDLYVVHEAPPLKPVGDPVEHLTYDELRTITYYRRKFHTGERVVEIFLYESLGQDEMIDFILSNYSGGKRDDEVNSLKNKVKKMGEIILKNSIEIATLYIKLKKKFTPSKN